MLTDTKEEVIVFLPPGVSAGPGVGPSAAAQLLEEAALPEGGEGSQGNYADGGGRRSGCFQGTHQVTRRPWS